MQLLDEIQLEVQSGKGGDGICSFRREKFIPLGGPDGGDGGNGGNIYIKAKTNILSLLKFKNKNKYKAKNGIDGSSKNCNGADGEDIVLDVPIGTKVFDSKTKELVLDIRKKEKKYLILKGGSKGYGNARFKSSINRAPRKITKGNLGEYKLLKLELNVFSNLCLLGLPNSGNSSIISEISNIKSLVTPYPFSTSRILLGFNKSYMERFRIIDLPSIINKSSYKRGVGFSFLKHITRVKFLFYVVDISYVSIEEIINNLNVLSYELYVFNKMYFFKKRYIIINKIDKIESNLVVNFIKVIFARLNRENYCKVICTSMLNKNTLSFCKDLVLSDCI